MRANPLEYGLDGVEISVKNATMLAIFLVIETVGCRRFIVCSNGRAAARLKCSRFAISVSNEST
jgi:hypothetical protein